ncbi:MAG TPA: cupin domain-containing protein [Thermomicrobiales bacterium]|jgi:quercetin dioxygenase-like cupin family protein|nr:cupin domain-containing protein [Chloroflexota bacterium]HBY44750.1 cupin domain-containing protein [Chloroflexota bacterium]HCG28926.1 cupin domain-containing protein [Chloroflexota bacterium]HQZ90034.1 cupin domain-containing protein [Thermomicrobiales bacterium]HRA32461.1 cupin domain-containing protein [Thermomicrobiales bacterium]
MDHESVLAVFDLDQEVDRFLPGGGHSGRRAQILVKADRLRVVLVTMNAGVELHEHTAPGPITIQTLRGRMAVSVGTGEVTLDVGAMIAIVEGAPHSVRAVEDGAFLLTIGYPSARAAAADDHLPFDRE